MSDFIYLASQSPRRSQLLTQLGVKHVLLLPDASEDAESMEAVLPSETPLKYVQRVTDLKWHAAHRRRALRDLPPAPILCSDTTVALGRKILGKPQNVDDAARMIKDLSGRTHRVLTAISLGMNRPPVRACSVSLVTFTPLSDDEIASYIETGESMGKAGAYAVQGLAAAFISRISGSYSGIMGLPLFETAQALSRLK
jgi:septum formation protein